MVDDVNPSNQFHPYSPSDAIPHTEQPERGAVHEMLGRVGLDGDSLGAIGERLKHVDLRQSASKAREIARSKPALALGGLAAAAIGMGLLRKRNSR